MAWYATKKASKLLSMDKSKILVFDLETTGLSSTIDEILQISILDGYGKVLFSSYIKPIIHKLWPGAQKVNKISPEMVKDAPTISMVKKEIQEIFNNALLVVGYNVSFDIDFMEAAGIVVGGKIFDVMTAFASYRAGVEHSFYRKCRLTECAEYFGYRFNPHDALEDTRATLHCFNSLIADERFTTYKKKEQKKLQEERPIVKKQTKFTLAFHGGQKRAIFRWVLLMLIAIVVLSLSSNIMVKDVNSLKLLFIYGRDNFTSGLQISISIVVIILGCLMIGIRILRMIIMLPKRMFIHIQRVFKRLFT